jgi:hypothetical protein
MDLWRLHGGLLGSPKRRGTSSLVERLASHEVFCAVKLDVGLYFSRSKWGKLCPVCKMYNVPSRSGRRTGAVKTARTVRRCCKRTSARFICLDRPHHGKRDISWLFPQMTRAATFIRNARNLTNSMGQGPS